MKGNITSNCLVFSRFKHIAFTKHYILRALEYEALNTITLNGKIIDIGGTRENSYIHRFRINGTLETLNISPSHGGGADILADLNQPLPIPECAYDTLICFNTLEHIKNDQLAIKEMIRILKPGGSFYIIVPYLYRVHGSPDDYHRHTASWWEQTIESLGIPENQFTIEPLVWDELATAYSLMAEYMWHFYNILKPLVLLSGLIREKLCRSRKNRSTIDTYALGWFIKGKK